MAQERKKRRIVLASILKPVDDTRMFEKMGVTLAESGDYEVSIIGYPTTSKPTVPEIDVFPLAPFARLSFQRLIAKWRIFGKVWKIRPSLLIITTHELLVPSVLLKILFGTIVIYDVQENYYRNILSSGSFTGLIRWPMAMLVRLKEKLLAPCLDHFLIAERGYLQEFKFFRGGWTVVENKAQSSSKQLPLTIPLSSGRLPLKQRGLNLLFSGTLSDSTGVFQAIHLAKELHKIDPAVTLTIAGKAALKHDQEKIQNEIRQHSFITLTGGDKLVPHIEIIQFIANADFGIISYPYSDHTKNSHPTKLFEYLHYQLPVILDSHWPWIENYLEYQPFVFFDFLQPDFQALLDDLTYKSFYPSVPENVTWESEKVGFLNAVNNL